MALNKRFIGNFTIPATTYNNQQLSAYFLISTPDQWSVGTKSGTCFMQCPSALNGVQFQLIVPGNTTPNQGTFNSSNTLQVPSSLKTVGVQPAMDVLSGFTSASQLTKPVASNDTFQLAIYPTQGNLTLGSAVTVPLYVVDGLA